MSRADELRAELAAVELGERLVQAKETGADTAELKLELRYTRWVLRGGPAEEKTLLDAGEPHTNRHVAEMYQRWLSEQEG